MIGVLKASKNGIDSVGSEKDRKYKNGREQACTLLACDVHEDVFKKMMRARRE